MPSTVSGLSEAEAAPYPWFLEHVRTSLLKKTFSPLYFTVGLVEEVAELSEALSSEHGSEENVVSEAAVTSLPEILSFS